jgi:hypothetical protein
LSDHGVEASLAACADDAVVERRAVRARKQQKRIQLQGCKIDGLLRGGRVAGGQRRNHRLLGEKSELEDPIAIQSGRTRRRAP